MMVRKPDRVTKLALVVGEMWIVVVILYSLGVPRLCGNHLSGTELGILNATVTKVAEAVDAGRECTETGREVTLSSGMDIEMEGDLTATTDRRARVTLTTQSADSFGLAVGV